ncbi:ribbon-helix-helix domain-containing protein [Ralstonia solanacearum]|uniref:ribbon-helix-helix domain-containing protein n=1 Tax=Ralstonia solanacearum TaxID=305 RepID=UPI002305CF99|nr:CopG family transcriptional regulator [Ralstonia solanacearum]MDB0516280.1 ribbon-helix-helix domain-containing protein [Ralstonia solanacearum]
MSIQRKPKTAAKTADDFVSGAPDAGAAASADYEKGIKKGNKRQITLTIAPDLLRRVDEAAQRTGQGRAAIINMAIFRALEGDIFKS